MQIAEVISGTMARAAFEANPDLDTYFNTDAEARLIASALIN